MKRASLVMPRWLSTAPFGNPVVPDVYSRAAASPGRTSGKEGSAGAADARKPCHSVNKMASRRSGNPGRTDSKDFAIGVGAVLRQEEQSGGAGLSQHVLELSRGVGRVDRYQHQARQGGPILKDHPLRDVGRPGC